MRQSQLLLLPALLLIFRVVPLARAQMPNANMPLQLGTPVERTLGPGQAHN